MCPKEGKKKDNEEQPTKSFDWEEKAGSFVIAIPSK